MELRTRKNWTQEKLADKAIVSVRTVQNIERGRPTQRSTLARLANALGVTASDLTFVVTPAQTTPNRDLMFAVAPAQITPDRGRSAFTEVADDNISKRTQSKLLRAIVVLFLVGAAGYITCAFLNAWAFSPLQRYYWIYYVNTEVFEGARGNYQLLEVVDRRGEHRIATDSDVAPAAIHGHQLIPFVLSAQARQLGAIDLALNSVHYGSAQMHHVLATSIYGGRSVMELLEPVWVVGFGVFALSIFFLFRHRTGRRGSATRAPKPTNDHDY